MKTSLLLMVMIAVSVVMILAACAPAAPAEPAAPAAPAEPSGGTVDAKALTEEKCTICHDFGRVENAQKSEADWASTVDRMIAKGNKMQLTDAEKAAVIGYLAATYK